jgi:hypothetical protein
VISAQRLATQAAALCGTVVLTGWVGVTPIEDRRSPPLSVHTEALDAPQATAMRSNADSDSGTATAAVTTMEGSGQAGEVALPDPSQLLPREASPVQIAMASTPDPLHTDAKEAVSAVQTVDECLMAELCIDQYLWSLYQRTPKFDTIKVVEQRRVGVKKNGKLRTIIEQITILVDEDFTWKDPRAAERAGMSLMEYVIGGMDRNFKLKLYHALRAMDDAGLSPGITSAFRDDYRQSLASGLKAATNRSYHGGSLRGGYGHGLAVDVVSVKSDKCAARSVSSENLWKWIDTNGKEFGIGRPYLDKDPAHVAPIDGKEYADHHREASRQNVAILNTKRMSAMGLLARDDRIGRAQH